MYIDTLSSMLQQLSAYLLPAQCLLCRLPSQGSLLCLYCQKALLKPRPHCLHCALPLIKNEAYCSQCMHHTDAFTQIYALDDYIKPYPALIKNLKYNKQLLNAQLLAQLLSLSIQQNIPAEQISQVDFLIPVPLHPKRLRQRGFNQAQLLADVLAKNLSIPILNQAVQRIKNTCAQEGLNKQKRKKNLKGAFTLQKEQQASLKDAYVVIIDDVVSTGATANSLCTILLQGGARRVDIWAICRTSRQPKQIISP